MYTLMFLGAVGLVLLAALGVQSVPTSEERRRLSAILSNFPANSQVSFTGTVTSASTSVSAVSSFAGLRLGMTITGVAVPAGATIVAMDSVAATLTLSAAATATHAAEALTASWMVSGGSGAQVHLYAAAFTGGTDPTPADFTEATFDTYAALDVTAVQGPYTNPDGTAEADCGNFGWVLFAVPTVGNAQIFGYWVDYPNPAGAGRVVSFWENLPAPLPMDDVGNAVVLSIPISIPDPGAAVQP